MSPHGPWGNRRRIDIGPPFGDLYFLAAQVANRSLSAEAALGRAREKTLPPVPPGLLKECLVAAVRLVPEQPETVYHWWRLILAAVEARHRPHRRSVWWTAADGFVEITRESLIVRPWGGRLSEALRTADLQTAQLEHGITELAGRGVGRSIATAAERSELTECRVAAAWLLAGPYCSSLDPEDIQGSFERWTNPFRLRVERVFAVFSENASELDVDYARWSLDPDLAMPSPRSALEDALRRLDLALRDAPPPLRGHCQLKRAQVLPLLARLDPEGAVRHWAAAQHAVQEIWASVDRRRPLDEFFRAVAPVVRHLNLTQTQRLKPLLTMPLSRLRRYVDGPHLLQVLANVSVFVENPRDLRDLWDVVHTVLEEHENLSVVPWVWRDLAHRLPGDLLRCPQRPVALNELKAGIEALGRRRRISPGERAATLVHAALHAPDEDLASVVELLDRIFDVDDSFRARHTWLLKYLTASHRLRYATWLREQGRHREALLEYAMASEDLTLIGARHSAAGLLTHLASEAVGVADEAGRARSDFEALLLLKSVEPVVASLVGPEDDRSSFIRDLGQEVMRLIVPCASTSLHAAQHLLFKAYAFRLLMDQPGPRAPTEAMRGLDARIAAQERLTGPYVPDRLGPMGDMDGDPEGVSGLYFLTAHESAPKSDGEDSCGHLRRVADQRITTDMTHGPHRPRYEDMRRPDLLEIGELGRAGFDERTVFISLFLTDHVQNAAGVWATRAPLFSLQVTSGNFEGTALPLNVPSGTLRTFDPQRRITQTWNWTMLTVAEVREEVNTDPGANPVTLHGVDLLERNFQLSGITLEQLGRWRAQGRTHLCFWPHGPLHYLPFHLLHVDGRPLADDWTVTTVVTSAQALPRPTDTARRHRRLLIAGSASGGTAYGLPEQPEIEKHVAKLTAQIAGAQTLGKGATTPQAVMAAVTGVDCLHIAAHGSQDAEAPWYQCLYLDADGSGEGRLFAHQILGLDLRGVELVTLSACESALGRYDLNDNLRGLPAAFMLAGASTVIGVLWPVTAPVATLFYEDLYRCLPTMGTKREAFRHAQQTTRTTFPAYRDWGAFTLIGDWR